MQCNNHLENGTKVHSHTKQPIEAIHVYIPCLAYQTRPYVKQAQHNLFTTLAILIHQPHLRLLLGPLFCGTMRTKSEAEGPKDAFLNLELIDRLV